MRKDIRKIAVIIYLSVLFLTYALVATAHNGEISDDVSFLTNNDLHDSSSSDDVYVCFRTDKYHFSSDEIINVSYTFSSNTHIKEIEYAEVGFEIINVSGDSQEVNKLNIEVRCSSNVIESLINIDVYLSSSQKQSVFLCAIKNESGVFISPYSLDNAQSKYENYAKSNGLMEDQETIVFTDVVTDEISAPSLELSDVQVQLSEEQTEIVSSVSSTDSLTGYINVEGELVWYDDNAIYPHPVRRVMVKLFAKTGLGNILIGTTYTDNDGNYSFSVNGLGSLFENNYLRVFIEVYAGDSNVIVENEYGEDYSLVIDRNSTVSLAGSTPESSIEISKYFLTGDDFSKALQISQALLTARDYAWVMMGEMPTDIAAVYPYDDPDDPYRCFYRNSENKIFITGLAPKDGMPASYASWDVIMHEYGHHIQYLTNIAGISGYKHWFGTNLADYYEDKSIGCLLAWKEAWPTIFAFQAQKYWSTHLQNIDTINDGTYDAYNFSAPYSIETAYENDLQGEACESAIIGVLYDIFDSAKATGDENDNISLGHQAFWESTTDYGSKHFADFIYHFYQDYPYLIDDLGPNLSYYQMAPTVPTLSASVTPSRTVPPQIEWIAQGGSDTYGNEEFKVIFYDGNGEKIFETEKVTTTSYTLSDTQWNQILYSYGQTYKVAVAGVQICGTETDNQYEVEYISGQSSFDKPEANNLSSTINISSGTKIRESKNSLLPGQQINFVLKFATPGEWLIQTFGTKDTYIKLYSYNGSTLLTDDDSGYGNNGLFTYSFESGLVYTVKITFYDPNEAGDFKLVITPANGNANQGATQISKYEDIYTISNTLNTTLDTSLDPNQTKVFTFIPSETGNYTFTINSDFDTYIYVINPNYTELFVYNVDCNDDSGEGLNPLLTKRLIAGVPYFIICSAYNPNSITETKELSLIVTKND